MSKIVWPTYLTVAYLSFIPSTRHIVVGQQMLKKEGERGSKKEGRKGWKDISKEGKKKRKKIYRPKTTFLCVTQKSFPKEES